MRIDAPGVENDKEALFLMTYHLRMAAAYFEATPTDRPNAFMHGEFSKPAIEAWLAQMEALYTEETNEASKG